MTLYCGIRNIDEIMDIAGLTNKEKTLMHLRDLYEQGLITRFTAETGNCDEVEIYYSINDAGKIAFDELWDKYGEDIMDDAGGGVLWLRVNDTIRIKDGLNFHIKYNKRMILKSWNGMGGYK